MLRIVFVILCFGLVYACQFKELEMYNEDEVLITVDTLDIEQIKIETH